MLDIKLVDHAYLIQSERVIRKFTTAVLRIIY